MTKLQNLHNCSGQNKNTCFEFRFDEKCILFNNVLRLFPMIDAYLGHYQTTINFLPKIVNGFFN